MQEIRAKFLYFQKHPSGAFLDTAASAQKPESVINAMVHMAGHNYANIHRGAYALSANATTLYENAREAVASFINAKKSREIIFTRNATEGINLVASSYGELLSEGDVILTTELEHHSNIVPWQLLAQRKSLQLVFVKITEKAEIDWEDFAVKFKKHQPKLIALTMQANAFGTVTDLNKLQKIIVGTETKVLLDACQSILHEQIDVQKLPVDFLVFSGHKLYGPTGIGVLYAKEQLLEMMPPYQGGGDMITSVSTSGSTWAPLPNKFEAGTPAIMQAVGLGAAIDFVNEIGFDYIKANDNSLTEAALTLLKSDPSISIYGTADSTTQKSIISFNIDGVHAHDFATIADSCDLQLRAGFHCAMPALEALGLSSTARISFGVYSQESDLIKLEEAIEKAKKIFK